MMTQLQALKGELAQRQSGQGPQSTGSLFTPNTLENPLAGGHPFDLPAFPEMPPPMDMPDMKP